MNRNNDSIENALYNLAEELGVTVPAEGNIANKINYMAKNAEEALNDDVPESVRFGIFYNNSGEIIEDGVFDPTATLVHGNGKRETVTGAKNIVAAVVNLINTGKKIIFERAFISKLVGENMTFEYQYIGGFNYAYRMIADPVTHLPTIHELTFTTTVYDKRTGKDHIYAITMDSTGAGYYNDVATSHSANS